MANPDFIFRLHSIEPFPTFFVEVFKPGSFISWLLNPALGEELALMFRGQFIKFNSLIERRQFCLGLDQAMSIRNKGRTSIPTGITDLSF